MYSAAEWSATDPVSTWDPVLKAAHSRWGGGRELGHVTLLALLDLICQLQASAEEIAETLLAQAPQEVQQVMIPSRTRAKILSSEFSNISLLKGRGASPSSKARNDDVDRCDRLAACVFKPQCCSVLTAFQQGLSSTTPLGRQHATEQTAVSSCLAIRAAPSASA